MAVDECVGYEQNAFLGVNQVHCAKVVVAFAHTNNLACHLEGVRVFGVKTRDECIGLASLYHHHAKVVALVHLVLSLLGGIALALHFLGKDLRIAVAALVLGVVAQIEYFDAVEVEFQLFGNFAYLHIVAQ